MRPSGRHLAKATFVLLALLVGKELGSSLPDTSDALRPFEVAGLAGQEVELRTATVQVEEVQLASTLLTPLAGYRTPGLWVMATVAVTPTQDNAALAFTSVRSTDGVRSWEGRTRDTLNCPRTPPGVVAVCDLIFEVPPDALPGAQLVLATEVDDRHDTVAVIDLGLSRAQVDRALEAEEPLEARAPRVGDARG